MTVPADVPPVLVDDDPVALRAMAQFLSRHGVLVGTAESVEGAFANGALVAIVFNASAPVEAEVVANDSRVVRFLSKPCDDRVLLATVQSAVAERNLGHENDRLKLLLQVQHSTLAAANRDLEEKIEERTVLITRAKREWEVAFDAISEPLMIIDRDYRVIRANLALASDLGRNVRSVVGEKCHELRARSESHELPRGDHGVCQGCPVAQAISANSWASAELETKQGRIYSLGAFPVEDERGAVVCHYKDLTEERSLSRQLVQAEKLSAMGLLAGGVAHEINNPLGAILAFSQLLRREEMPAEERNDYLKEIEESAVRCKKIVERLLRFARQGKKDDRRLFSLNEVVSDALFLVQKSYLQKGLQLSTDLAEDLWPCIGNSSEISQVLLNLITNARDAMPNGGSVRVSTRNLVEENAVELIVADSGEGIPPEVLRRIYDPFFTTKPEGKGTGLGLAVSYGIVRDHNGHINVKSKVGDGTEFFVVLPRGDLTPGETEILI